jgi:hypothetical protein
MAAKKDTRKRHTNRAASLSSWFKKNKTKPSVRVEGKIARVVYEGRPKKVQAYRIPREFLMLNDKNHRFTTDWDNLLAERKQKPFNPDNEDDVKAVRKVIQGAYPYKPDRKQKFDDLVDDMRSVSQDFGGNGQIDPGVILEDGTYINGNRRECALEHLREEYLNSSKAKRSGVRTSHFDVMDVGICQTGTTESDIRLMELREQVSEDLRDEYDEMNTAMLVNQQFQAQYNKKVKPSMSPKKKVNLKKRVISEIASVTAGKGIKKIEGYLEFMEFVDQVLIAMEKPGRYELVNQSSGSEKPFSYKLTDAKPKWAKLPTKKDKIDYATNMAMSVVMHQIVPAREFPRGAKGYRAFRYSLDNPKTKKLVDDARKKFSFKKPNLKTIAPALKIVKSAIQKSELEREARSPTEHLENIQNVLKKVGADLTSGDVEAKLKVLANNKDLIDDIKERIGQVGSALAKYERKARKTKPKRKRSRKSGTRKKNKPKRRR